MNRKVQFAGISGVIFIMFGLITNFLISYDPFHLVYIHFALGVFFLLLFLFKGGIQFLKTSATKRVTGFSIGVGLYTLMFLICVVLVNFMATRHQFIYYDSTSEKVYTLAPQTRKVLSSLKQGIVFRGFFMKNKLEDPLLGLIKRITKSSPQITWELIDPEASPGIAKKYSIDSSSVLLIAFKDESISRNIKIVGEVTEQKIVNAIRKLTHGGTKKVYYITGNGEPKLSSKGAGGYAEFRGAIKDENINLSEFVLRPNTALPNDIDALILATPSRKLTDSQYRVIERYLETGGNAFLLHEPRRSMDIPKLASRFGIKVGNDVVLDKVENLYAGPALGVEPLVNTYGTHPITADMHGATIFKITSSVQIMGQKSENTSLTELALTGINSWAETNLNKLFARPPMANLGPEDRKGPVPVAVAYQHFFKGEKKTKVQRIVVVGDADFVSNKDLNQVYNRDFALNCLNWVIGEDSNITIRARSLHRSLKGVTTAQFGIMFLITSVLLPEFLLLIGLGTWWKRES